VEVALVMFTFPADFDPDRELKKAREAKYVLVDTNYKVGNGNF